MKFIRILKAQLSLQEKIEEFLKIVNKINSSSSEFEGLENKEVLVDRAKILNLEHIIDELKTTTNIDEDSEQQFIKYKDDDNYFYAEVYFKDILNKADKDKVEYIIDNNIK